VVAQRLGKLPLAQTLLPILLLSGLAVAYQVLAYAIGSRGEATCRLLQASEKGRQNSTSSKEVAKVTQNLPI